jgi:hypothetical protein
MMQTRKTRLIAVALAACMGAGGLALAGGTTAKDAYKSSRERIAAQAKAERKACERLQGNAHDLCDAQAKGREQVARAQLEAKFKPSPETEKLAKNARADAAYQVAKVRCEAGPRGSARERCLEVAKGVHEAAIRQAKVEKVQELREDKAKAAQHAVQQAAPKS